MSAVWKILKSAVRGYIANEALSRGAAISFYAVTSLTPILLIVVAVAGVAFGNDLVRDSLIREMGGVLGQESGELVKSMLAKSSDPKTGTSATIFGVVMLLVTASGVFGEMQSGAFLTALMFTAGKSLIGWYLGTTATSSGNGAAGALIVILLWTYYSAQIFLFGSEVTKAIADTRSDNTKAATLPKPPRQMRSAH
jgi:membrane protein